MRKDQTIYVLKIMLLMKQRRDFFCNIQRVYYICRYVYRVFFIKCFLIALFSVLHVTGAKTKKFRKIVLNRNILAMQGCLTVLLEQYTACPIHVYPADMEDKTDTALQGLHWLE